MYREFALAAAWREFCFFGAMLREDRRRVAPRSIVLLAVAVAAVACSGAVVSSSAVLSDAGSPPRASEAGSAAPPSEAGTPSGCDSMSGAPLGAARYDVTRSRFAFGSTPTSEPFGSDGVRYVGTQGVLVVQPNGRMDASPNGGAPATQLPTWSADTEALKQHAKEYFALVAVEPCQIGPVGIGSGGSGGVCSVGPDDASTCSPMTITYTAMLGRAVDGIRIASSRASVDFRAGDVTVHESMYWPALSADVVAAARAFRDRLKDPIELAAYRAKLPAEAQGSGEVEIVHSSSFSNPFRALAVWTVLISTYTRASYDESGNRVELY